MLKRLGFARNRVDYKILSIIILAITLTLFAWTPYIPSVSASSALSGTGLPPFVGRICIVPGDSLLCPQTLPQMIADSTGHLVVSINILNSTIFNAFGVSVRWDPTIMNATSADLTNTILQSPTVSANCINNVGVDCGPQDGPGVAHVDLVGANTTAPASGRLFKVSLTGLPLVNPHIGFATGCSTISIGLASALSSVPNADLCVVMGIFRTTICTTLCTETLISIPESIQSQLLGVHLPTGVASAGGNIVGVEDSGLAPTYATTWIMPYPITMPGNITSWKAQFRPEFLSSDATYLVSGPVTSVAPQTLGESDASCKAGDVLTGGGNSVNHPNGGGELVVTDMFPATASPPTTWRALAFNEQPVGGSSLNLVGVAVCQTPSRSSSSTVPSTPTSVQIEVLRKNLNNSSILTVVEAGPLHDPRPVLEARLPSYPNSLTGSTIIEYFTDTLLTVLPGDLIGLNITADPQVGSYTYPEVNATGGTRFVPRNQR